MKSKQQPPFGLRMPEELKDQVKCSASENSRSMNTEIVFRLKKSFEKEAIAKK